MHFKTVITVTQTLKSRAGGAGGQVRRLKWPFRSGGEVPRERLGAVAILHTLKRHLGLRVSHVVDGSISGGGYRVIFVVLTIGISLFTASLGAEGHGNYFFFPERSFPRLCSTYGLHIPCTCSPSACSSGSEGGGFSSGDRRRPLKPWLLALGARVCYLNPELRCPRG